MKRSAVSCEWGSNFPPYCSNGLRVSTVHKTMASVRPSQKGASRACVTGENSRARVALGRERQAAWRCVGRTIPIELSLPNRTMMSFGGPKQNRMSLSEALVRLL